jgi:hypothetical protein
MKKQLLLVTILHMMISCNGQQNRPATSLAKEPVQLENFNFNTKISTLLPADTKSKDYAGYFQVKGEFIAIDTIADGNLSGNEKPFRIEYRQRSYSSRDVLAKFGDHEYNAVNLATTMDGKLMLISAVVGKTTINDTNDLVAYLTRKHGKPIKTKGDFANKVFDIYTWQLKDRMIRYSMVLDSEENTLKIEIDQKRKQIKGGDKTPHYTGYIFVIKNEYKDKLFENRSAGDFVYLQ